MDLFAFIKPKNELEQQGEEPVTKKRTPYVPDEMWTKCPECGTLLLTTDIEENLQVCSKCNHHFRLGARKRIEIIADKDSFVEMDSEFMSTNIIGFPGYDDKLKKGREKSGENESVICGECLIRGIKTVIISMNAEFMMGSMGTVTGDKITRAFEYATEKGLPVVAFTVSGGARMQEGILSLMQMAKTSGAVKQHSDAGLLYITVLTDPTSGGVTASFAMEGDIILAEPKALIAFAGPRVIEQTIRQKLPRDFQTAEFLQAKGFVDKVVDRRYLKDTIGHLLKIHNYEEVEPDERV